MVLLLCAFDLGPPLAFNDDWTYAWMVRHFNWLHPQVYPTASALALVQTVWGWVVTFGHPDQRLLRLSVVPFVLLAMWMLYLLARRVGADKTWSAIAALAPLSFPVFSADATTFMSDVPYAGLLLVAAYGAVRWLEGGGKRWIVLCLMLAGVATLQRQTGAAIPLALSAALWLQAGGWRSWRRSEWVGLVLLWGICLLALVIPALAGITTATQGSRLASLLTFRPVEFLLALIFLPGALGLGLALFLPGMAFEASVPVNWKRVRPWVLRLLILELLILALTSSIFAGNVFTQYGFTSIIHEDRLGQKPLLFATPVFLAIEAVAVATVLIAMRRWHDWWPGKANRAGLTLLLLAVGQFLPLLLVQYLFDRYYIPVVLLMVPVIAQAASRSARPVLAARLALAMAVAGALIYVVGEQDYQAWQVARNNATCLAYQYASPMQVDSGYEELAVYVEVPYYEQHGVILGGVALPNTPYFSLKGPADPVISVKFAPTNDPRPGYSYSSLASGKLVLVPGPHGQGLGIQVPSGPPPTCPTTG